MEGRAELMSSDSWTRSAGCYLKCGFVTDTRPRVRGILASCDDGHSMAPVADPDAPTVEAIMDGRSTPLRARLSRRERQTLLYTAAGMKRPKIAALLRVEQTTVRTYQERFTAKLGGVNAQHAASRALMLGEFKKLSTIDAAAHREP
jgi:DNA-binding CsgD family transcriptional regulator